MLNGLQVSKTMSNDDLNKAMMWVGYYMTKNNIPIDVVNYIYSLLMEQCACTKSTHHMCQPRGQVTSHLFVVVGYS